ncbi:hypothetical protein S40293_07001 [Stachybotrys chartarum IBT 40293]|nr:hypothetical protein S40293_07001 [Stachybotrys chartarum IBT 40293]
MGFYRPVAAFKHVLPLLCTGLFLVQFAYTLSDVPSIKLLQDIICKDQYSFVQSDVLMPESTCSGEAVQRRLNMISVGMAVAATTAGALASIPFGILGDRIGRLPVLAMSLLGMVLSLGYSIYVIKQRGRIPLEALWASGIPILLGGGRGVVEAMVFAMVSDVTAASHTNQRPTRRAAAFQCVVASVLLGQLVGQLLSAVFMKRSIWLPIYLSLSIAVLASLFLVIATPETCQRYNIKHCVSTTSHSDDVPRRRTLRALFSRPTAWLLPGTLLVMPVATMQSGILLQAMHVLFEWPLEHSGLLLGLRTLVTLATLLLLLPCLYWLYSKKFPGSESTRRDLTLARLSALLFMFGSLCLLMVNDEPLVVTGVCISALGSGVPALSRSLLSTFLHEHQTGFLFGVLAVGEVLGMLASQLGMGWLFDIGLQVWPGLPFCPALVVAVGLTLALYIVQASAAQEPNELDVAVWEPRRIC